MDGAKSAQKDRCTMTRYTVADMRFVPNSAKGLEKNPEKMGTVHGTFTDENGNILSVKAKPVSWADAKNPETLIDVVNGVLILPSGERGRKPSVGVGQSDIDSLLESARNSAAE